MTDAAQPRAPLTSSTAPAAPLQRQLFDAILMARKRVYAAAGQTPLHQIELPVAAQVWLKREDLSPINAYKWRGAYNCMAQLTPEQRHRGVVCASAGNHAQGVALAAQRLGVSAAVFMPNSTPRMKHQAVQRLGGDAVDVHLVGDTFDAAKQAAAMVLRADNFTTIVRAVEHGRTIFANIRRSVMFMLCTNVAEVLAVSIATFAAWTLPLRPLQILYLNVLTDVFPALALGVSAGSGLEMKDPPRDPKEAILTRGHWIRILVWSAILATGVLGSMHIAEQWLEFDTGAAVTVSFLTLGFSKLWFTFNLRNPRGGLIRNEVVQNPWVWGAIALCIVLLVLAVYLPGLSDVLGTENIGWKGWGVLLGFSVAPLIIGQIWLLARGGARLRTEPADDQSGQRDTKRQEGAEE